MWPFNSKKSFLSSGLLEGMTDCHCHILPGVDDGIQSMDETLAVLKKYGEWGIREVWLTPHIMEDMPNTTDGLRHRFEELMSACEAKGGEMPEMRLMAENMIDNLFAERLAADDLLLYGRDGKELLVETSYMQPPIGFHEVLSAIQGKGLVPILAHPERYVYMDEDEYERLYQSGVRFQMNITSLCGSYGQQAQHKAEYLLSRNYYRYRGTDCHNLGGLAHELKQKALKAPLVQRLEY